MKKDPLFVFRDGHDPSIPHVTTKPHIKKWIGGWECCDDELCFSGNSPSDAWHAWAFGRGFSMKAPDSARISPYLVHYRYLPDAPKGFWKELFGSRRRH